MRDVNIINKAEVLLTAQLMSVLNSASISQASKFINKIGDELGQNTTIKYEYEGSNQFIYILSRKLNTQWILCKWTDVTECDDVMVHFSNADSEGFYASYMERAKEVYKSCKKDDVFNLHKSAKLIIGGYSLGGGVAQCLHHICKQNCMQPITYTFGSVASNNKKIYDHNVINLFLMKDPVRLFPPKFRHMGQEWLIDRKTGFIVKETKFTKFIMSMVVRLYCLFSDWDMLLMNMRKIEGHSLDLYISALKK